MVEKEKEKEEVKPKTFEEFLLETPPSVEELISISKYETVSGNRKIPSFNINSITLTCEKCDGKRIFDPTQFTIYPNPGSNNIFLTYNCRNCRQYSKTYSLKFEFNNNNAIRIIKYGEIPDFGEPTPTKLTNLLGKDINTFLQGRKCENKGLGIGAFSYYRRIVENMKDKLFDEIIKVVKLNPSDDLKEKIEELEREKSNFQFSSAIESIKVTIPQSLLIEGENPLLLLHKALSKGMHAKTDEENLSISRHIRIVLSGFAQRLSDLLKENEELKESIKKLK